MNSLHSSHSLSLRQADISDLNTLVELENEIFSYDQVNRRSFKSFIDSKNDVWVAEKNNQLVGYLIVFKRQGSRKQRMFSLAVSPKCQGQGIGRLLILHAIEQGRGMKSIRLEVKVDNSGAIKLYESLGFVQVSRVEGFYSDGTAAYIYIKDLE